MPPTPLRDRHGLALSTDSALAAERYGQGIDRQISLDAGAEASLRATIEADPEFALAHAGLAFTQFYWGQVDAARESAAIARALANGITRREQRHVECIALFVGGQPRPALALVREHLAESPRDALTVVVATMIISASGRSERLREAHALLSGVAPAFGDDWWFLGAYAFAHHELDWLDDARRLAERSLALNPRNPAGAHPLAHVFYEANDHASGADFLGGWLVEYDPAAPFHGHLSWHLALFELAAGREDRALELYERAISPTVARGRTALVDAASLLWRYQIYGCRSRTLPWADVCELAARATAKPGLALLDSHAALAYAAMGDQVAMGRLLDGLRGLAASGHPLAGSLVLPLAQGLAAFAQGGYDEAVRLIEPLADQLVRVGGSHAQREVFEDTLLEAYFRSGRLEQAETLLRERLGRRTTARDLFWQQVVGGRW